MARTPMVHGPSRFDNSNEAMAKETAMFERIVVAVDQSEQAQWAMTAAIDLAQMMKAELTLVHVLKPPFDRDDEQKSQGLLEHLQSTAPASVKTRTDSRKGNVVAEIVGAAEETKAGLIVMGTHGRGRLTQLLLGSTTEGVARWGPCPVLTVRQPWVPRTRAFNTFGPSPFRRVLIAVDASEPALAALAAGFEMARRTGAPVSVIHVADTLHPWQGEMRQVGLAPLSEIRRQGQLLLSRIMADQSADERCETILREGNPAKEILDAALDWEADLIVIGSQGHGHIEQFVLGSVANAVLRGALCPVMLVRPEAVIPPKANVRKNYAVSATQL
jgi:nucleotide-binding universal stress UspA family protein